MKRTVGLLTILIIELFLSLFIQFNESSKLIIVALFALNFILFLLLLLEPYWKIGAWLTYLVNVEVYLFILNLLFFKLYLKYSILINTVSLFLGVLIVFIAYRLKLKKIDYSEDFEAELFEGDTEKDNDKDLEKEDLPEPPKPKDVNNKTYIATKNNTIHLESCSIVKKAKDTKIIGSTRYAKSSKFTACKVCKPFS